MTEEFISKIVNTSVYQLKQGTKFSFYYKSGTKMLPNRLSIMSDSYCEPVSRSGRGLLPRVAQIKGSFNKSEDSVYKQFKPYEINTSIWQVPGLQRYFYGTIGITSQSGKIEKDCGDLALIFTNDWQQLEIHIFKGLAMETHLPEYLQQAVSFLQSQKEWPATRPAIHEQKAND